jgi:hypothetical protein
MPNAAKNQDGAQAVNKIDLSPCPNPNMNVGSVFGGQVNAVEWKRRLGRKG